MSQLSVYLTGLTGTVAPFLKQSFLRHHIVQVGHHIHLNEVSQIVISLDDIWAQPIHYLFHLALGPIEWATALATYAFEKRIPFVYISTASVFDDNASGPYTIEAIPKPQSGYGLYKYQCEQAVKKVNPHAFIIRIGWQIDPNQNPTTNNMFKFFHDQRQTQGKITVSSRFYPSSSFLPDTTDALVNIALTQRPGLYHVNGNHSLSLFEIALKLNERYQLDWVIEKDDTFARNDVLLDHRIHIPFL
jgi:dTDP-4-dehydrorhamnose reductase